MPSRVWRLFLTRWSSSRSSVPFCSSAASSRDRSRSLRRIPALSATIFSVSSLNRSWAASSRRSSRSGSPTSPTRAPRQRHRRSPPSDVRSRRRPGTPWAEPDARRSSVATASGGSAASPASRRPASGPPRSRNTPALAWRMAPAGVSRRAGSSRAARNRRAASSAILVRRPEILARLRVGLVARDQVDDDAAARVPLRDGLLELDARVAEVLRRDPAEHVRGHHAQGGAVADELAERAGAVAEHDPALVLPDDEEVALDAPLEVD